jgi:HAE1 family hydrophobic/amphiphilic exporter-1
MQSSDTESLFRVGPEMLEKIAKLDGLRDVTGDLYVKNPQMTIEINREAAAVYGISLDQIRQELYDCFGTRQVATIYTASNDYQVILECSKDIQADPSGLSKIFLKTNLNGTPTNGAVVAAGSGVNGSTSPTGPAVPLSAVTRLVPSVGALQVNHQGQQPSMTISFNLTATRSARRATPSCRSSATRICRPRSLPDSRAPRRCSRSRSRASGCWCSPRSSRPT